MVEASALLVILLLAHVSLDFWMSSYCALKSPANRSERSVSA